jgi:hypothetical protein
MTPYQLHEALGHRITRYFPSVRSSPSETPHRTSDSSHNGRAYHERAESLRFIASRRDKIRAAIAAAE